MTLAFAFATDAEWGLDPTITFELLPRHCMTTRKSWSAPRLSEESDGDADEDDSKGKEKDDCEYKELKVEPLGETWFVAIGQERYRIVRTINSYRAEALYGKATRVWEVKREGDLDGKSLILKEAWPETARTREHIIQQQIQDDIKNAVEKGKLDAQHASHAMNAFFTHVGWSTDDSTEQIVTRGTESLDFSCLLVEPLVPRPSGKSNVLKRTRAESDSQPGHVSTRAGSIPRSGVSAGRSARELEIRGKLSLTGSFHRVHYKLLTKEVGTPFRLVTDLRTSLTLTLHLAHCECINSIRSCSHEFYSCVYYWSSGVGSSRYKSRERLSCLERSRSCGTRSTQSAHHRRDTQNGRFRVRQKV